ncbi:MAG: hypothetical protein ACLUI3_14960 [Christensenellales bacterium]
MSCKRTPFSRNANMAAAHLVRAGTSYAGRREKPGGAFTGSWA